MEEPGRHATLQFELGAEAVEQLGQAVHSVHHGGPGPGQMIEPDVLELDGVGVDPEIVADAALDVDGHVAQADSAVALVDQRLGHDAHRVGEVDHPGPRRGAGRGLLGDLQDEGYRAEGLGQTAGPGGLLPEAPVPDGQGLIGVAGGLAPHPELDDHEVGPVDGPVPVVRGDQVTGPAPPPQDAAGQAGHHLETLGVRIEQDQLVDHQTVLVGAQAVHQLRGVRTPPADHGHLRTHPPERNITHRMTVERGYG